MNGSASRRRSSGSCPPPGGGFRLACLNCGLRELCLPFGLSEEEMARLDGLVSCRVNVRRGEALYLAGQPFHAFFAVRAGFFKRRTASENGREHVAGFQMAGELLGLDGVGSGQYTCDALALEDSQVCVIPYARMEHLSCEFAGLRQQFHRILGREIVRDQGVMRLLGSMKAEERLAAFLLHLSRRLEARGFSPTSFILRMTRQEIGTHLGLTLETISRCFSRFQEDGLLRVRYKQVEIVCPAGLRALAEGRIPATAAAVRK
jgi:CRP/FNR family transcriptional regulator